MKTGQPRKTSTTDGIDGRTQPDSLCTLGPTHPRRTRNAWLDRLLGSRRLRARVRPRGVHCDRDLELDTCGDGLGPTSTACRRVTGPSSGTGLVLGRGLLALDRNVLCVDPRSLGTSAARRDLAGAALLPLRRATRLRDRTLGAPALKRPLAFVAAAALTLSLGGTAMADSPILHEPVASDPHEDLAFEATVDGDIPAALRTSSGIVSAPDPRREVNATDPRYGTDAARDIPTSAEFSPDRDTRRPDVMPYDEPFSPSIAPFKRLVAYDTVTKDFLLGVRDSITDDVPLVSARREDGSDDHFFADMVVDVVAGQRVRIPSLGPSTRVLHAKLAVGLDEVPFTIVKDSAENWFVRGKRTTRARLVMELAIARSTFGGVFQHPEWSALPPVPPLPSNVHDTALTIASHIGVSRNMPVVDVVTKLVAYFRSFADSNDPPHESANVYVDLAMSKKGVCRHRAYAFAVTALALGLPTRMVINEAHAWVEVFDGAAYRVIDLGGAGRLSLAPQGDNTRYAPPSDVFAWPAGATRGEDLADETGSTGPNAAPKSSSGMPDDPGATGTASGVTRTSGAPSAAPSAKPTPSARSAANLEVDARPTSSLRMTLASAQAKRGAPFSVEGSVEAGGKSCPRVLVEVLLHATAQGKDHGKDRMLGSVATDESGRFKSSIVMPAHTPVGAYEIVSRTRGDSRCGAGGAE